MIDVDPRVYEGNFLVVLVVTGEDGDDSYVLSHVWTHTAGRPFIQSVRCRVKKIAGGPVVPWERADVLFEFSGLAREETRVFR